MSEQPEITLRELLDARERAIAGELGGRLAEFGGRLDAIVDQLEQSSREHGEVRKDLRALTDLVARSATNEEIASFKRHVANELAALEADVDRRLEPLQKDYDERIGGIRARWGIVRVLVAGCTIGGTVAGLVIALVRSFVPVA